VLFLDEPSTGLDPQARLFVHERINDLRADGVTVVLTTHDMDEAEKLSERVGVVDHGRLLTLDTPEALIKSLPGSGSVDATLRPSGFDVEKISTLLSAVDGVEQVERIGSAEADGEVPLRLRLYVHGEPAALLGPVAQTLHERDVTVSDFALGSATLEDVFTDLTGKELR
jgi:ABC-2 type transport system ATP-binding protein